MVEMAQTAFPIQGDKEKVIAAGWDDYISKQIKRIELYEIIDTFIDQNKRWKSML